MHQNLDERGGPEPERGSWAVFKAYADEVGQKSIKRARKLRQAPHAAAAPDEEHVSLRNDGLPHFVFRGQGDAEWPLVSAFDRLFVDSGSGRGPRRIDQHRRNACHREMLGRFREAIARLDAMDSDQVSDSDAASLGQHYGVPTRLLDWTASPYAAAFFACAAALQFTSDRPQNPAIWVLDCDHVIWAHGGVKILPPATAPNPRAYRQQSFFTLAETYHHTLEEFVRAQDAIWHDSSASSQMPLTRFTLSHASVVEALYDLELMGIRGSTLFDGLAGAAWEAKVIGLRSTMDDYLASGG